MKRLVAIVTLLVLLLAFAGTASAAHYGPSTFTFTKSNTGTPKYYDGKYAAFEITASCPSDDNRAWGQQVVIELYRTDNMLPICYWYIAVGSGMHKYDWIYMGEYGANYYLRYAAPSAGNAPIQMTVTSYSWE